MTKGLLIYLYADVLFFINFAMDFILLSIVNLILKLYGSKARMAAGSAAGALWAVFAAVYVLPIWLEIVVSYFLVCIIMLIISFGRAGIRKLVIETLVFYMAAIMAGGGFYMLYQHTRAGYYLEMTMQGNAFEAMPLYIWILLMTGIYFGIRFLWLNLCEIQKRRKYIYKVTLYYGEKEQRLMALVDTGNHLYEPVTHKPVHIVTYDSCRQLFNGAAVQAFVPFQSIGKENGMMPVVFPDRMCVERDGKVIEITKPVIGISKHRLSPSGEYEMLLHDEL